MFPLRRPATQQPFVVLCRLPRGPAGMGGACSHHASDTDWWAGQRRFPPPFPPLRELDFGCEASGCEPGGLWSAFWAPSL